MESVTSVYLCTLLIATFGPYRLFNIYAPSGSNKTCEREQFYGQDLFSLLQLSADSLLIWGGDYNCLLKEIDVEGGKGFQSKKCSELADIVASFHLVDAFRFLYPGKQEFTFYRPGSAASRLVKIWWVVDFLLRFSL